MKKLIFEAIGLLVVAVFTVQAAYDRILSCERGRALASRLYTLNVRRHGELT